MRNEFSRVLSKTTGTTDQRIEQIRRQMQLLQEETEDMLRSMRKTMTGLQEQIEALEKQIDAANEEA